MWVGADQAGCSAEGEAVGVPAKKGVQANIAISRNVRAMVKEILALMVASSAWLFADPEKDFRIRSRQGWFDERGNAIRKIQRV